MRRQTIACHVCFHPNDVGYPACLYCGNDLIPAPPPSWPAAEPRPRRHRRPRGGRRLLLVLAVTALSSMALGVLFVTTPPVSQHRMVVREELGVVDAGEQQSLPEESSKARRGERASADQATIREQQPGRRVLRLLARTARRVVGIVPAEPAEELNPDEVVRDLRCKDLVFASMCVSHHAYSLGLLGRIWIEIDG